MDEQCEACGAKCSSVDLECCCGDCIGICGECGAGDIAAWKAEHANCDGPKSITNGWRCVPESALRAWVNEP